MGQITITGREAGTFSEIGIALEAKKKVVALKSSRGLAAMLGGVVIDV